MAEKNNIKEIYNKIFNDKEIRQIYKDIEKYEVENEFWAFHNFKHIENVIQTIDTLLNSFKIDENEIYKVKIACLLHDVGAIQGKENHAYRSFEYAQKYFENKNIFFDGMNDVLEAIKIHSAGFDTKNIIALTLILADKLDVKYNRITLEGSKIIGNRQYQYVKDITIKIEDKKLVINFLVSDKFDREELENFYFTTKIFNAIKSFCKKMDLEPVVLINNEAWKKFRETL